ncbi:hypothetical protein PUNSTDRAFT_129341 [Punctularia strigosozonata HHB-11173 SS5]|uniref:uncharacterized protein n=1 Tax=Punctularia strigosozonata (strain HHB-11173) TaxID=741275 RepID=UPI000441863F|nr:uncharacterized protein PUNSTDRAFT_129341 [Punctularia strigosozonata HHB-11173 SS5]EIN13667.1 hypothetical protein PUNSTDRAFT_129341 [Punctularia strigosozonata HHB-11173 SS5]
MGSSRAAIQKSQPDTAAATQPEPLSTPPRRPEVRKKQDSSATTPRREDERDLSRTLSQGTRGDRPADAPRPVSSSETSAAIKDKSLNTMFPDAIARPPQNRTASQATVTSRLAQPPVAGPSSSSMAPAPAPPPPTTSAPLLPPGPPPAQFQPITSKRSPLPEPSEEEKRAAWGERIPLFSEAVKNHDARSALEKEYKQVKALAGSPHFARLPPDAAEKITTRIAMLETQRVALANANNEILTRLVETNFWPVLSSAVIIDNEAQVARIESFVEEIKATTAELHVKSDAVVAALQASQRATVTGSTTGDAGSSRPAKRRRVEDDGADADTIMDDVGSKEIAEFQSHVAKLEDRVLSLENYWIQYEQDLADNLDVRIAEQIEEHSETLYKQVAEVREQLVAKVAADLAGKSSILEADVVRIDQDITDLATEVAKLWHDSQDDGKISSLIQDKEQLREQFEKVCTLPTPRKYLSLSTFYRRALPSQLQEEHATLIAEEEVNSKQIDTIKYLLQTHIQNRPKSPSPPPDPAPLPFSPDVLFEHVKEPLLIYIRESVLPLLHALRQEIETMMQAHRTEIFQTVWDKLGQTLRFVDIISKWMQRQQQAVANPQQQQQQPQQQQPQPRPQGQMLPPPTIPSGAQRRPPPSA